MSLGELETYASAKAAEEAQAAAQAAQAVEEAQAAMQAAQAAMTAGQAAKLSKERRLGLLQKRSRKRSRRQGEWDVLFGRTPAGVRPTPDGAEDEEDDIRDFGSAAAAAAAAGGGQDGGVFR